METDELTDEESLAEKLEEELGVFVCLSIDEVVKDPSIVINLWFNDMFGWALSYSASFVSSTLDLHKAIDIFKIWYIAEGKRLVDAFRAVEYPSKEKGTYTSEHISKYFRENIKLARPLFISLNKISVQEIGKEVNTDFINLTDEEIDRLGVM